jgi:hypothetical protein
MQTFASIVFLLLLSASAALNDSHQGLNNIAVATEKASYLSGEEEAIWCLVGILGTPVASILFIFAKCLVSGA